VTAPFPTEQVALHIAHMKRLTASEARRVWFGLLDEVVRGEVVVIERRGRRIVLRAEPTPPDRDAPVAYASLLRVPDLQQEVRLPRRG